MVIGPLQEDFARAVRDAIRKLEEYLGSGKCSDFNDYTKKAGKIAGLKEALELFNSVAKRHGELEDSD